MTLAHGAVVGLRLTLFFGFCAETLVSARPRLHTDAAQGEQRLKENAAEYRVTDLGTLPGCDVTYATGVNDSGLVVGYAYPHVPPGHGNSLLSRPFRWEKGVITELAKLGGEHGQALTVNSKGDIGGYAELPDVDHRPVVWRRSGGYIPEALSSRSGRVLALSDDGVAAGHVNEFDAQKNRSMRACLWKGGKEQVVGDGDDVENVVTGIGPDGVPVGYFVPKGQSRASMMSEGDTHAAIWRDGKRSPLPEADADKPQPGGFPARRLSSCDAINVRGVVAGWCDTLAGRRACLWREGKIELLADVAGFTSQAHSINDRGDVVGEAMERANRPGWVWAAILWRNGKAYDLNRLIPAGSGWKLSVAKQISNSGLIVGYGSYDKYPNAYWRAFLLTPIRRQSPD